MEIVTKLGRAGGFKNRERMRQEWNRLYGEGNWEVVYYYNKQIYTRDQALEEFYHKSYLMFMKKHPEIVDELCKMAKELYNPHAESTTGVDLQCPAVYKALETLGRTLEGTERVAIGTWGYNRGIKYPMISLKLSPFQVPIWCENKLSVESFWQNYKYLAVK